eukprot:SAG11_NODE_1620_length_4569_cov_2.059955_3_plen_163_part_00
MIVPLYWLHATHTLVKRNGVNIEVVHRVYHLVEALQSNQCVPFATEHLKTLLTNDNDHSCCEYCKKSVAVGGGATQDELITEGTELKNYCLATSNDEMVRAFLPRGGGGKSEAMEKLQGELNFQSLMRSLKPQLDDERFENMHQKLRKLLGIEGMVSAAPAS